jgi:hypothetical protein
VEPGHEPLRREDPASAPLAVVALDVGAKVLLLFALTRVALDPAWGNLEGKAPMTRALTYPMLAFLVPFGCLWRSTTVPYPWVADLMLTVPAFSDLLGNRFDLYDRVTWFDDVMHFVCTGTLSAAVVLLTGAAQASLRRRLEIAVAAGLTLALTWEVWEYLAFVTRSGEVGTAYRDTVGDLALGWLGAVAAAVLLGLQGVVNGHHSEVAALEGRLVGRPEKSPTGVLGPVDREDGRSSDVVEGSAAGHRDVRRWRETPPR